MIELLVGVVAIGVVVWVLQRYLPLPQPFMGIIMVIGVLICLVLVLRAFGVMGVGDSGLPRLR